MTTEPESPGAQGPTQDNPYAPPSTAIEREASDAEAIRAQHLRHEATLKSAGALYILGSVVGIILSVAGLAYGDVELDALGISGRVIAAIVFIGSGIVGIALRQLKRWSRWPATVLSIFGLLGFPFGTILNGYILWLLWSAKGRRIMAPDYLDIVAATPDMRYRTSKIVLGFVFVLLACFIAIIAMAFLR